MVLQKLNVKNPINLLHSFLNLFGEKYFTYLFLLNIVSNFSYSFSYHPFSYNPFIAILLMLCLSGSFALLEVLVLRFLRKVKLLRMIYLLLVILIYTILILADYFCLFNFQTTFNQEKLDILRETNSKETTEFLNTYLSFGLVFGGLFCVLLMHIILLLLSFAISKIKRIRIFFAIISIITPIRFKKRSFMSF